MEIVISVVAKVAEYLVAPIAHPFTYCYSYKTNFEDLKKKFVELKITRDTVKHRVDDSKLKGEEILPQVDEWMISVDKVIYEVEKLIEDEEKSNKRVCLNLKNRYQFSKMAEREVKAIAGLQEGGRFNDVSYCTIPVEIWLKSTGDYMDFESRNSTLKKILDALGNPELNMIGVYGMGGIGKTTLVKEVARQAKKDELFDKVVTAHVSKTPDIKKIQEEIAEKLGLGFKEQSETVRAGRLYEQLKKEKQILIILDDVWERLDLDAVGIPLGDGSSGCKVLITARIQDVLSCQMDSQHNFSVDVLNEKEAWSLFKKMAGDCIENDELKSVATDIVKVCAGMPLAIVTVARALRNKRLFEWKDSLRQLRRPSWRNFSGIQAMVYSCIELSYNHLEDEEVKKTFLLIGYTFVTGIQDLLLYGMGLDLFQNISTMEEARDRVFTLVDKLKNSCLLLDGHATERFSMHDFVRDVAISIASRDQSVFRVKDEVVLNWPDKDMAKVCTAISFRRNGINGQIPQGLEYPQLKFLCISNNPSLKMPDNFFTGMIELRVMDFTRMHLLSLPASFSLLLNLQTLCLDSCQLENIAIIGDLKKLEILTLRGSDIEQLVEEIGQLTQLRLLDLSRCYRLKVIPPNVISRLLRLEELYMGNSWVQWEVEGLNTERTNASLEEFKYLSHLTALEINIGDASIVPKGLFSEKLQRFKICIGYQATWFENSRTLKLRLGNNTSFQDGVIKLKGIGHLYLDNLLGVKNVPCELVGRDFSQLKKLNVRKSPDLEKICHGINNGEAIEFLQLYSITLTSLPQLRSFCAQVQKELITDSRSNEIILDDEPLFNEKVKFSNLQELKLTELNIGKIWHAQHQAMSCSFQRLSRLIVVGCGNLKYVFPSYMVKSFQQLQYLEISNCTTLEEIVAKETAAEAAPRFVFPRVTYLSLCNLPEVRTFYPGTHTSEWPMLKQLKVKGCDRVKILTSEFLSFQERQHLFLVEKVFSELEELSTSRKGIETIWQGQFPPEMFHKLKVVEIVGDESTVFSLNLLQRLYMLEKLKLIRSSYKEIFLYDQVDEQSGKLPLIKYLELFQLPDLKHICKEDSKLYQNLETLSVSFCDNLINLVPSSSSASFQNLTTLQVQWCNGLVNIATFPTAKTLVRLKMLDIHNCKMMKEIVSNEENVEKEEIVFSELKKLSLEDLESLTSFCSGNYTFFFPSLEVLVLNKCPKMKIFSGGVLSTPLLQKVYSDNERCWEGDLNTTIERLSAQSLTEDSGQLLTHHQE